jgi:hypothetical protein
VAWQGRQGCRGKAGLVLAQRGLAWHGAVGQGKAGVAWLGIAWLGQSQRGPAWPSGAGQGRLTPGGRFADLALAKSEASPQYAAKSCANGLAAPFFC